MEVASVGRLLAACIVIACVLGGIQYAAARFGRARIERGFGGRLVSLVETTYLPGGASLHVVRVVGRFFVVGRNAAALATLGEIAAEDVERFRLEQPAVRVPAVGSLLRFTYRGRGRGP